MIPMRIALISAICLCVLLSCTPYQKISKNGKSPYVITLHEGEWITNFKNEVFIRCVKKLYPASFSEAVAAVDASTAANLEHLNFDEAVIHQADSLASSFVNRKEFSWEIENTKVILNFCLYYRNSKELDKLTMKLYRVFVSSRNDP